MVWIRTDSRGAIEVSRDPGEVRALLADIPGHARLMPGVDLLERRPGESPSGTEIYHYVLTTVTNGAVRMTPDYEVTFDRADEGALRWEPHGVHNFRSGGVLRTSGGAAPGTSVVEIETWSEAQVDIAPVMVPLVEPFARRTSDDVTVGFLSAIKSAAEARHAAEAPVR
ncbi:SRPBCC family protein [Microbispora sp. NPDC049125]|uniref:SRPBCC family protein n=1 Tax=Microbispora sp. NPDC049125 TaxID=3154929 RepID=UPI003466B6BD